MNAAKNLKRVNAVSDAPVLISYNIFDHTELQIKKQFKPPQRGNKYGILEAKPSLNYLD